MQDLFLDQQTEREAAAAVPDRFVDEAALVGPRGSGSRRDSTCGASAGATSLLCSTPQVEALRVMAELTL